VSGEEGKVPVRLVGMRGLKIWLAWNELQFERGDGRECTKLKVSESRVGGKEKSVLTKQG